MFKTWKRK